MFGKLSKCNGASKVKLLAIFFLRACRNPVLGKTEVHKIIPY